MQATKDTENDACSSSNDQLKQNQSHLSGEKGKDDTGIQSDDAKSAEESAEVASNDSPVDLMEMLARFMQSSLGVGSEEEEKREPVIDEFTLAGIAKYIKSDKCKSVIVMTGAGVSTSAGIPDFCSPGTGLYDNLAKFNLPTPQSIFDLDFFLENPEPFFKLAKELYPGNYQPTPSHFFIKLLEEKNFLLRNFTQNIDGLELIAGVSPELVVAAHGTFHSSHCVECRKDYSQQWAKERIFKDEIPKCSECKGLVKPDIVFFGEGLPSRFFELVSADFRKCDLLIVMGTSLVVQPFASLIDRVSDSTPRLLINKEKCAVGGFFGGFDFDSDRKYRDVAHLITCDEGCYQLADLLGWKDDLVKMVEKGNKEVMRKAESQTKSSKP